MLSQKVCVGENVSTKEVFAKYYYDHDCFTVSRGNELNVVRTVVKGIKKKRKRKWENDKTNLVLLYKSS